MSYDPSATIGGLRLDQIARLAQAMYEPTVSSDPVLFESAPPDIRDALAEVGETVGVDTTSLTSLSADELARLVLKEAVERDDGRLGDLVTRVRRETMMSTTDTAILVCVLTYAVRNLVSFEVDNRGKGGRVRWRVRLAGAVAETSDALRVWLGRLSHLRDRVLPRQDS
jgi:hypothetical protein